MKFTAKNTPMHLRPENWPAYDMSELPHDVQLRITCYAKGFEEYFRTGSTTKGAAEIGKNISAIQLLRAFRRCMTMRDGKIIGLAALIPYSRVGDYERIKDVASSSRPGGFAGAMSKLLREQPAILEALIGAIHGEVSEGRPALSRQSASNVYKEFVNACRNTFKKNGTPKAYPFNTANKGKREVFRFCTRYLSTEHAALPLWIGDVAAGKLQTGNAKGNTFTLHSQPFDVVSIDAHTVHAFATVRTDTPHGPIYTAIDRAILCVVHEVETSAALGYSLTQSEDLTAEDIEDALISTQQQWSPMKLKYETYKKGSGFPCGTVLGLASCPIASLRMDNAPAHTASILEKAAESLGITCFYGPLGKFWTNATQERFHATLNSKMINFLPGATGRGPEDGHAPADPAGEAVKHQFEWQQLHEIVEVFLAEYNSTPNSRSSSMSPLQAIRHFVNRTGADIFPRTPAPLNPFAPRLGWEKSLATVRGGEGRHPFFRKDERRYTSKELAADFKHINTVLTMHRRRSDSKVEAFFANGTSIGEVLDLHRKMQPMPSKLLKLINRRRNHTHNSEESTYEEMLTEQQLLLAQDIEERPDRVSKAGTRLVETLRKVQHLPPIISGPKDAVRSKRRMAQPKEITLPRLPGAKLIDKRRLKLR